MNTFYQFTVTYYEDLNGKSITEHGFLCASSYKDAMDQLTNYYGDSDIEYCSLKYLCDDLIRSSNLTLIEAVASDDLNHM